MQALQEQQFKEKLNLFGPNWSVENLAKEILILIRICIEVLDNLVVVLGLLFSI